MIRVTEFIKLGKEELAELFSSIPIEEYEALDYSGNYSANYDIPKRLVSGLENTKGKIIKKIERPILMYVSRFGPSVVSFCILHRASKYVASVTIRYNFEKQKIRSILWYMDTSTSPIDARSLNDVLWDI